MPEGVGGPFEYVDDAGVRELRDPGVDDVDEQAPGHVAELQPVVIDLNGHSAGTSVYQQQIDWTYYAKNEVVAPADAVARAAALRAEGTDFRDTLVC